MLLFCFGVLPLMRLTVLLFVWSPVAIVAGVLLATGWYLVIPLDGAATARRLAAWRDAASVRSALWLGLVGVFGLIGILLVNRWWAERFWLRVYRVEGDSMAPALVPGDYVLARRSCAAPACVHPGQIIVFESMDRPNTYIVKRVTAVDASGLTVRGDNPVESRQPGLWHDPPDACPGDRLQNRALVGAWAAGTVGAVWTAPWRLSALGG